MFNKFKIWFNKKLRRKVSYQTAVQRIVEQNPEIYTWEKWVEGGGCFCGEEHFYSAGEMSEINR